MDSQIFKVENIENVPIESIVRAYRRQETLRRNSTVDERGLSQITQTLINVCEDNNLDELALSIGQEIISSTILKSENAERSSKICLWLYRIILYLAYAVITVAGVLGINGLNDLSKGKDIEGTMVFVTGIMSAAGLALSGINELFDFGSRSRKLHKYHKKFNHHILVARQVLAGGDQPLDMLDKFTNLEMDIDRIDTKVFPKEFKLSLVTGKRPTFDPVVGRRMCQIRALNRSNVDEVHLHIDSDSSDSD